MNINEDKLIMKHCYKCDKDKPISEYFKDRSKKDGCRTMCKDCSRIYKKEYRAKNKDNFRVLDKRYRDKHPHRGVGQYQKYKEKRIIYDTNRRIKVKMEVITHYGNGKCACVRCGFDDILALTIDHINGNGGEHRKRDRNVDGNRVYEWLKRNKFPEGYQTLCMNCQFIKRIENNEFAIKNKSSEVK